MDRNDNSIEKNPVNNEDVIPENIKTEDDVLIDEIFTDSPVKRTAPPRQTRMKAVPAFSAADVREAADAVNRLLEAGKCERALDIVFSLKGAFRAAVRDAATVTIPMGSHDNELRRIAAGALVQSYLELGKISLSDVEDKLYAIIESSEPEYDDDDEIIEQTPDQILYKVTACVVFACALTEGSGNHQSEKSAMYLSADSVLDTFLSRNLDSVMRKYRKRMTVLAEAVRMQGGTVGMKFSRYVDESARKSRSPILRFLGDKTSFRVAAGVLLALCLVSIVVYLCSRSSLLSFVATDSAVMLFIVGAEAFFIVGMTTLALLIGFGSEDEDTSRRSARRK